MIQGEFPERYRYTEQMLSIFGPGGEDRLYSLNVIPERIGRTKDEWQFGAPGRLQIELEWQHHHSTNQDRCLCRASFPDP